VAPKATKENISHVMADFSQGAPSGSLENLDRPSKKLQTLSNKTSRRPQTSLLEMQ